MHQLKDGAVGTTDIDNDKIHLLIWRSSYTGKISLDSSSYPLEYENWHFKDVIRILPDGFPDADLVMILVPGILLFFF